MAILRVIKDQLLSDRRQRAGELSAVDIEGVMTDGSEDIEDFYVGIVAQSVSADLYQRLARDASASHPLNLSNSQEPESDMFALRFGIQDDRFVDASTGFPRDEGLCRKGREKDVDDSSAKP